MLNERDRAAARARAQAEIDAAAGDLARGAIPKAEWQRRVSAALASSYLADGDPRWQSGFDGDPELWRQARELVLDAVPGGGSLLDVGCANGFLVECLDAWARERGLELDLFGLELDPDLADAARRRLPRWADRVYTGNVSDWVPPRRFTYVRTGLEYVPPGHEPALIRRLLRDVVEPGGRLLVGPVYDGDVEKTVRAFAHAGIPRPGRVPSTDRNGKTRWMVWASAGGHPAGHESSRENDQ